MKELSEKIRKLDEQVIELRRDIKKLGGIEWNERKSQCPKRYTMLKLKL